MEEDKIKDEKNSEVAFKDSFMSNLIDMSIIFILSLIALLVFDKIILRILGYKLVSEYIVLMLIIILAIISVLYPTYMECKKGATIGKKFSKMKIVQMGEITEIEQVDEVNTVDETNEVNEKETEDKE
ncbi:RDD family protein [Clostridium cochlearium]|uniref:RDD domain-containing protein n=1 Tax=Clostridium cochlearium TaxID=1494 RepID=A0A7Y3V759_CLOCO|nr:RDD family protein [Clostridium cochlearium]NOH15969.1 hypothetical protein [Clostridium cochlearium]